MRDSDWTESVILAEWVEMECEHLDLIASWETLLSVYQTLGFQGPDSDDLRLAEFKTIITEVNKFLTRMRNGLSKVSSAEDAISFLMSHAGTADVNTVRTRPSVAYNKLKQRWILMAVTMLTNAMNTDQAGEGEHDAD